MKAHPLPEVYLARHGETEWSLTGQHTGLSDIPLTARGERNAARLGERLRGISFDRVAASPLQRAHRTCEIAGFGDRAILDPELVEVNYGDYDGRRTVDIRQERPGWDFFRDGCPNGESIEQIIARADRVVARLRTLGESRVLLFSHGHFLLFVAARWIGLPAEAARHFFLDTTALSIVGYKQTLEETVIRLWNDDHHVGD